MTADSPATRECIERALHYLRLSRVNARQVEPRMNINDAIFHLEEALKETPDSWLAVSKSPENAVEPTAAAGS